MACDIRNAPEVLAASSAASCSAGTSSSSSRGRLRKVRQTSRASSHQRQVHIAELLASFAQDISNVAVAHGDEDAEAIAAELALLDEDPPLEISSDSPTAVATAAAIAATSQGTSVNAVGGEVRGAATACGSREPSLGGSPTRPDVDDAWPADMVCPRVAWGGASPVDSGTAGRTTAPLRGDEESDSMLSSGVIQAMVHDYSVLKRNVRDYDVALGAALGEVERLETKVAYMQCARGEVVELQALLGSEAETQRALQQDKAELTANIAVLRLVIQGALEADGDIESSAFVEALVSERNMLWKLLQLSQSVSSSPSYALQMPHSDYSDSLSHRSRPSLGTRSRTSSGSTSSAASRNRHSPSHPSSSSGIEVNGAGSFQDLPPAPLTDSMPASGSPGRGAVASSEGLETAPMEALSSKALAILQGTGNLQDVDGLNSLVPDLRKINAANRRRNLDSVEVYATAEEVLDDLVCGSLEMTMDRTAAGRRPTPLAGIAAPVGAAQTREQALDEDEMSEVSSLVESAIFLGSPKLDSQTRSVDLGLCSSLLPPAAAIAGVVGAERSVDSDAIAGASSEPTGGNRLEE